MDGGGQVLAGEGSGEAGDGQSVVPPSDHGGQHLEVRLPSRPPGASTSTRVLYLEAALRRRVRYSREALPSDTVQTVH